MKNSRMVFAGVILVIAAHSVVAQRMLLDPRYLNEFPSVERIKAEMKGVDSVDTYARFVAALSVINQFMINDLVRAPNGGFYQMPPAADRVHDRYRIALTRYEIDSPEPPIRDPRYRATRNKYENDPAFADWLLQKFFSPQFRSDYYAWTRKQIPTAAAVSAVDPIKCPKVSVSGRSDVEEGQPATFTAAVVGNRSDTTFTYNWTLSAGTISSGQGTSTITVDTVREGGRTVTATVSVGGMDAKCNSSSSSTTGVIPKPPPAFMFDRFGLLGSGDREARLDNFAIAMQNDPTVRGHIIVYPERTSEKAAPAAMLITIEAYLVMKRGIEASRIVSVEGGVREKWTIELWIVPYRASPPEPTPIKPAAPATKKPA